MLPPEPKKVSAGRAIDNAPDSVAFAGQGEMDAPIHVAPTAPPTAVTAAPGLGAMLHALRRSWVLYVPAALIAGALAAFVVFLLVPGQYASSISFRILSRPPQGSLEAEDMFTNVQKAQVAYMKSSEVLTEAIEKSRVAEKYGMHVAPPELAKKLVTNFNDGPELLAVQLTGESAEGVAALLTAIGEVYTSRIEKADDARVRNRIAQLRRRLQTSERKDRNQAPSLAEQLEEKRALLIAAKKSSGLDDVRSLQARRDSARSMLDYAEKEFGKAYGNRVAAMQTLQHWKRQTQEDADTEISNAEVNQALRGDALYEDLLKSIKDKEKEITAARRTATDKVFIREYSYLLDQRAALERKRDRMQEDVRANLAAKVQRQVREGAKKAVRDAEIALANAKVLEDALKDEVQKRRTGLENLSEGNVAVPPGVLALEDEVKRLERESDKLGEDLAQMTASLPLQPRVRVVAPAYVPQNLDYKRSIKFAGGAGIGMFGLVLLGLCFLEASSRRVYTSDDVMQGLGLRVLGTLPMLPPAARRKSAQAQSLGGLDSRYGMTEAVDAVRTAVLHAHRGEGAKVVMITSAVSGEGKTTLASHLAASLARAWRKVLLIDADLRNPAQHGQFDLQLEPGLSEALRGEVEFEDVIRQTLLARLWVLPAGKVDMHALQALSQEGVAAIFERLKDEFDFIVIDTSPILPVPDALQLGPFADSVILSVLKDFSRMPTVYQAQQRLQNLGIHVLGSVVIGERTESYGHAVPYPKR